MLKSKNEWNVWVYLEKFNRNTQVNMHPELLMALLTHLLSDGLNGVSPGLHPFLLLLFDFSSFKQTCEDNL